METDDRHEKQAGSPLLWSGLEIVNDALKNELPEIKLKLAKILI
jgi:hypothetical protein